VTLYVDISINNERIGALAVTRTGGDGTNPNDINEYTWRYMCHGKQIAEGAVWHRYCDSALLLARAALRQADRHLPRELANQEAR
jgi:hypothetical protein